MKILQILTITLLVSLSLSTLVSNYETCKSTCDSTRQAALSSVDATDLVQLNKEWDTFIKCTTNTDGDNMVEGTTQADACVAYQATAANEAEKTDAKAPAYRELVYACNGICKSGDFTVTLNEKWDNCMDLCATELFTNPKVKEYEQCEQSCHTTLDSELLAEFQGNTPALLSLSSKMTSAAECMKTNQPCVDYRALKGDYEHADFFKLQVECSTACFGFAKIYTDNAGTSVPKSFNCIGQCAKDKLNSQVDFSGIIPENPETMASSMIIKYGILSLVAVLFVIL